MYVYYILRGTQADTSVEYEDELDEERFPELDLENGPVILNHLAQKLSSEAGTLISWQEAELTDSFFNREDSYIMYDGRWMRRSDAPWRKDKG